MNRHNRPLRRLPLAVLITSAMLSACATTAVDPVVEALDEKSGTTVTRLTDPITFIAEKARRSGQDPFAFLAPFEANRMGARRMHLWILIPNESGASAEVAVLNGDLELLRAVESIDEVRARELAAPYAAFATWQRAYIADLDAALLTKLADSGRLTIEVRQGGASERFSTENTAQPELRQFLQLLGL